MEVRLYSLSTCSYCRMAKRWLDDQGVGYKVIEVDLLEGEERQDEIAKVKGLTSSTVFPVITFGDEAVVGFNKPAISKLLGM
ncbi:MAG: glutaredoxin family protein [Coriobacteriia bacterium]|nr:glutaredoxin family protein [Coriobacteriia bacterium]